MTTHTSTEPERDQRLNAILLPLVRALERGEALDREQVLAAHPEFAAELAEFFAGRDCRGASWPPRRKGSHPPARSPTRGRLATSACSGRSAGTVPGGPCRRS